jgi:threonine synthase
MFYNSTRNSGIKVSSSQAIAQGISKEGGLFVPESLPQITLEDIKLLSEKSYVERAKFVLEKFLTDFSQEELNYCVENAYTAEKFKTDHIAELAHLYNGTYMLELWHGPTCAFKDMALQLLPYLLTVSAKKTAQGKEMVILVATSGDTGKAALEGFKDVEGTQILVFYPEDGVSAMQKRQMTTQEGSNVSVCAIKGNFDDAQNGVKAIFTSEEIANKLESNNRMFSSANSINWGRLVPQIVYYVSSYCELVKAGEIECGSPINAVVPTGNFGNILAAYYAKNMGIPMNKLICASNANKVLTDFINTGTYDRNREFKTTISPSMDILISSNLERLLYELSGNNDKLISEWFSGLSKDGKYTVSDDVKQKLEKDFYAGYCDDNQTKQTIKTIFDKYSYTCDTHTAVAVKVYEDYKQNTGDDTKTLIASTASPYKFTDSVLEALCDELKTENEFEQAVQLAEISKLKMPQELLALKNKEIRFNKSIEVSEMTEAVMDMLHLK